MPLSPNTLNLLEVLFNPLSPKSDRNQISPNSVNT